jgi:hypothetical protein
MGTNYMIYRIIAALLRFIHREGLLLRVADYFDPPDAVEVEVDREHPAA